jgi:hypothetical protein
MNRVLYKHMPEYRGQPLKQQVPMVPPRAGLMEWCAHPVAALSRF